MDICFSCNYQLWHINKLNNFILILILSKARFSRVRDQQMNTYYMLSFTNYLFHDKISMNICMDEKVHYLNLLLNTHNLMCKTIFLQINPLHFHKNKFTTKNIAGEKGWRSCLHAACRSISEDG